MEISLKYLRKLVDEFSTNSVSNASSYLVDYDHLCRHSSRLIPDKKLALSGYLCLHRRNYQLILADQTGWCYVQFLNLTESSHSATRVKIDNLLNRVRIDAFNLVVETLLSNSSSSSSHRRIFYIQADPTQCRFSTDEIHSAASLKDLVANECFASAQLSYELLRLYRNDVPSQFKYESYFKVDHITPIMSTMSSTVSRQLNVRLRADVKVSLLDPHNSNKRNVSSNYAIISLPGRQLFYYNFLHVGGVYALRSERPVSLYLNVCGAGSVLENSAKPVKSIMTLDDSIRIYDNVNLPIQYESNGQQSRTFDPNLDYIDHISGVLLEKRIKTNSSQLLGCSSSSAFDSNQSQQLIDNFDLILPNRELKLVVRPLGSRENIVVYFETRLSLYELGCVPGMLVSLVNLNKRLSEKSFYKASNHLKPLFDQRMNFSSSESIENAELVEQPAEEKTTPAVKKKQLSLYETLTQMDTIYDCFYKKYTASNILSTLPNEEQTNSTTISQEAVRTNSERFKLYYGSNKLGSYSGARLLLPIENYWRILGQVTRINELSMRITCRRCARLWNACQCGHNGPEEADEFMRVELTTLMQVDDHTSILKLAYATSSFDANSANRSSNLFGHMSASIVRMLSRHLAEINMPCVPIQAAINETGLDHESKLCQAIQEKLLGGTSVIDLSTTNNASVLGTADLNDPSSCFHLVKMDIYKCLYDYLMHTCVDKYFVFYVDPMDGENVREMSRLGHRGGPGASIHTSPSGKTFRPKNEFNHFCLNDLARNQQYLSTLTLRCFKFMPIDVDLA